MPIKTIATNRKALHNYDILDKVEAGLVLTGTEIKSIRAGRVNLGDAYARPDNGELWVYNMHISTYPQAGPFNHDPYRPRKLLLHKEQVSELVGKAAQKGLTLVPLKLYIKDHYAKMELAVARGRRVYDKRRAIAEKDARRQMERGVRRSLGR